MSRSDVAILLDILHDADINEPWPASDLAEVFDTTIREITNTLRLLEKQGKAKKVGTKPSRHGNRGRPCYMWAITDISRLEIARERESNHV